MELKITSKGIKITDSIQNNLKSKVRKNFHGLKEIISIHVFLSIEKKRHIAEISAVSKGGAAFRAHDVSDNLYVSIDGVLRKIEKHLRKTKDRRQDIKIRNGLAVKNTLDAQSDMLVQV
jgi:putative sigma-54 modulation protein